MSYEAESNALRAQFETTWAAATVIAWENAEFNPPDNASWVRFTTQHSTAFQASMGDPGNNFIRHPGVVTVMIFSPLNRGDKAALELADNAAAVFRGYQSAGVYFRSPPSIRRVGVDGKWYHINVVCPFERDTRL